METVPVTVVRVVDGDTAEMRMPDGSVEDVRFIGVDTPESTTRHEPYGSEASAYTEERLEDRQVFLQIGIEERDRYGRLLAYVWLERPVAGEGAEVREAMFNAHLLRDGYAQLLTIPPNVDYVDVFRELQTEAREASRGLWGLDAYP